MELKDIPSTPKLLAEVFNQTIQEEKADSGLNTNDISDGYHTFGELYDHRITLWIAVCKSQQHRFMHTNTKGVLSVWRTRLHSDGSEFEGWFVLGIGKDAGQQITYHLPISKWDDCDFAETLDKSPDWDGHTSADVLQRIAKMI